MALRTVGGGGGGGGGVGVDRGEIIFIGCKESLGKD